MYNRLEGKQKTDFYSPTRSSKRKTSPSLDKPEQVVPIYKKSRARSSGTVEEIASKSDTHEEKEQKETGEQESGNQDASKTRGFNFLTAVREVSTSQYYNVKDRLGLAKVPDCCYVTVCMRHSGSNAPYQVKHYERESFLINFKSNMWLDALDTFRDIIKHNKYPNIEIIVQILQIVLTLDDKTSTSSSQTIVNRCHQELKSLFYVHPPCSEAIRAFYKKILYSSVDLSDAFESYTKYDVNIGILKNAINILFHEMKSDHQKNTSNLKNSSKFENLEKHDRIQRLVIVLELVVDLLEKDLAIWITRHFPHPANKHLVHKNKPLIAWLLWQDGVLLTDSVNNYTHQIFQILVAFVDFNYPSTHIQVLSRLLSIIFQIYYLCDYFKLDFYPNLGHYCAIFSEEMLNTIKNRDVDNIVLIIGNIKPKQLQYLMSKSLIQTVLKWKESNYILMIQSIFKDRLYLNFSNESASLTQVPSSNDCVKTTVENIYKQDLRYFYNIFSDELTFEKLSLNSSKRQEINQSTFLHIVKLTLSYFYDIFNVARIQNRFDYLCSTPEKVETQNHNSAAEINVSKFKSLPLTQECYKEYRTIFNAMKNIKQDVSEIKDDHTNIFGTFVGFV